MFYVRLATSEHKRSTREIILWIMIYYTDAGFFQKIVE